MLGNNYLLWENDEFLVCTPHNPHLPYSEGPIIVVKTKLDVANAWQDPQLSGRAFALAAQICRIIERLELCPWFNIQSNGNWGLLPDAAPFFHIYIYGRRKTDRWARPVLLPETPGSYHNDPMPEKDRNVLIEAFRQIN